MIKFKKKIQFYFKKFFQLVFFLVYGKIKYRKDENMSVYPNINKVVSKLKWKPKINFNQGIKISINSLKKKYG